MNGIEQNIKQFSISTIYEVGKKLPQRECVKWVKINGEIPDYLKDEIVQYKEETGIPYGEQIAMLYNGFIAMKKNLEERDILIIKLTERLRQYEKEEEWK